MIRVGVIALGCDGDRLYNIKRTTSIKKRRAKGPKVVVDSVPWVAVILSPLLWRWLFLWAAILWFSRSPLCSVSLVLFLLFFLLFFLFYHLLNLVAGKGGKKIKRKIKRRKKKKAKAVRRSDDIPVTINQQSTYPSAA